jgi:UDP-N-acetylmuramyl pentapeptide phosphotransferase/UDP-N-acetylglucosamine-1-phosphate transferase
LSPEIKGFLSGAAVVVFLGMLDDKFSLPPKMKFLGEILAVVVFMNVSQISLQS